MSGLVEQLRRLQAKADEGTTYNFPRTIWRDSANEIVRLQLMVDDFEGERRKSVSVQTKLGLKMARERGVILGNPNIHEASKEVNTQRISDADAFAKSMAPIIREIQTSGIKTMRAIADALVMREVKTSTGREDWNHGTVWQLIRRIKAMERQNSNDRTS